MKTLSEWLHLLEARHPVEIQLGLDRIAAVVTRLGLARPARRVVVVGGTNGKGSCVRALEALALKAGLTVGVYTSPHLLRYNERVRLGGRDVEDQRFCDAFAHIESRRGDIPLTYFEVGTLAALLILCGQDLDLAVLEVGMGGRYDAVNIVDSDVAVITSVDLDHTHWLGNTRDAIGAEKAGIARRGKPLVCADPDPPGSLVTAVLEAGAKACFIGRDYHFRPGEGRLVVTLTDGRGGAVDYGDLPLPQLPVASAVAALQCLHFLDIALVPEAVAGVFATVSLAGRYQRVSLGDQAIILDVAHNPAAAACLAERLRAEGAPVVAVAAIMADKDVDGFIAPLVDVVEHWFVGNLPGVPRALDAGAFAARLGRLGVAHTVSESIGDSFEKALCRAAGKKTLVVCGSFFTISAIMQRLETDNDL